MYVEHNGRLKLQQGAILCGCVADGYDLSVNGLVITPRCDLGNGGKVSTVHYLPIVPIDEWVKRDLLSICMSKTRKILRLKLYKLLKEHKITDTVVDYLDETSLSSLLDLFKVKNKQDIIELYRDVKKLEDGYTIKGNKHVRDNISDELNRLFKGEHNRYYLIEDWSAPDKFNIIILRDVKRISFDIAKRFQMGFQAKNLDELTFEYNDLYHSSNNDMYKIVAAVNSPYIEHIIQSFSHNFCRIGVDDMDNTVALDILKKERIESVL